MSTLKHTPGPWTVVQKAGREGCDYVIVASGGEVSGCIAFINTRWPRPAQEAEQHSNLRLMAAAPELLEALIGVVRVADRATDEFDAARAAIAKATGESSHG